MHFCKRVSGVFSFLTSRACKQAALAVLLALALVGFAGAHSASAEVIDCTKGSPGPNMTIQIFNSTPDFDIYPLLFAGSASKFDQWMEACFRVLARDIDVNNNTLYPRASQYRMYINCCGPGEHGIPPGGSVTITLPFYSPLVQGDILPKPPSNGIEQFIDWWNGGGINVYAAPKGSPYPDPVSHHWADDFANNRVRTITRNAPSCRGANGVPAACPLHVFASPASIQNWEPQQLIEYTLAAGGLDGTRGDDPDKPLYIWDPKNVDYDVSFVNYAYLPAAIVPFASPLSGTCCEIGWIGSTATIQTTFKAIDDWRAGTFLGSNWPSYIDKFAPMTLPPEGRGAQSSVGP